METNLTLNSKEFFAESFRQIHNTAVNAYPTGGSLQVHQAHAALSAVIAQSKVLLAFLEALKESE